MVEEGKNTQAKEHQGSWIFNVIFTSSFLISVLQVCQDVFLNHKVSAPYEACSVGVWTFLIVYQAIKSNKDIYNEYVNDKSRKYGLKGFADFGIGVMLIISSMFAESKVNAMSFIIRPKLEYLWTDLQFFLLTWLMCFFGGLGVTAILIYLFIEIPVHRKMRRERKRKTDRKHTGKRPDTHRKNKGVH